MLTLILLVVLGGGAGLMAVWLIDARGLSRLLGRFAPGSLRRPRRRGTAGPAEGAEREDGRPALSAPGIAAVAAEPELLEPIASERAEPRFEPLPAPADRRGTAGIPSAFTAVEGTYREVARAPLWRKVVSLVSLLVILAAVGVAIAAFAGATLGAVAELVDGAVG